MASRVPPPHLIFSNGISRCSTCNKAFPLDSKPTLSAVFGKHIAEVHKSAKQAAAANLTKASSGNRHATRPRRSGTEPRVIGNQKGRGVPEGVITTQPKAPPVFPLRLPLSTRIEAAEIAERQRISLNQFILLAVAEKIARLSCRTPERPNNSHTHSRNALKTRK
jgi:hypothetical protein